LQLGSTGSARFEGDKKGESPDQSPLRAPRKVLSVETSGSSCELNDTRIAEAQVRNEGFWLLFLCWGVVSCVVCVCFVGVGEGRGLWGFVFVVGVVWLF